MFYVRGSGLSCTACRLALADRDYAGGNRQQFLHPNLLEFVAANNPAHLLHPQDQLLMFRTGILLWCFRILFVVDLRHLTLALVTGHAVHWHKCFRCEHTGWGRAAPPATARATISESFFVHFGKFEKSIRRT